MAKKNDLLLMQMSKYQIKIEDVMLAYLIAAGLKKGECFRVLYKPPVSDTEKLCDRFLKSNPKILSLINEIKSGSASSNQIDGDFDLRDKDGVLSALEAQYKNSTDAKQKADILMKIADLQKMKQDENTEKEKLIHYYLPFQWEQCPFQTNCNEAGVVCPWRKICTVGGQE